jgi:hypothetical protein
MDTKIAVIWAAIFVLKKIRLCLRNILGTWFIVILDMNFCDMLKGDISG